MGGVGGVVAIVVVVVEVVVVVVVVVAASGGSVTVAGAVAVVVVGVVEVGAVLPVPLRRRLLPLSLLCTGRLLPALHPCVSMIEAPQWRRICSMCSCWGGGRGGRGV